MGEIRDASKSYSVSIADRNRADRILSSFLEAEQSCIRDASETEAWLGRNHRIAPPIPTEIAQTRAAIFSEILDMVKSDRSIEVASYFYEGNGGIICYSPDTKTLFCDTHFWDLAWYVAADVYAETIRDDSEPLTNPGVLKTLKSSGIQYHIRCVRLF